MASGPALMMLLSKAKQKSGADEESGEGDGEDSAKFRDLAESAFPDEDWTDERVAALREFVKSCYEQEEE